MLDQVAKRLSTHRVSLSSADYHPNQAVVSGTLYEGTGDNLSVLFPPWHGGKNAYNILTKRLLRRGDSVLRYVFHNDILQPDIDKVKQSFGVIQSEVADDLHTIADQHRYNQIKLIAVSLGVPALAMVTSEFNRFDSATLVTPAPSLAHCTWSGIMTSDLRQVYEDSHVRDADELESLWPELAPINHVAALAGKDVHLTIAQNDAAIPSRFQNEYLQVLVQEGVNPKVTYSDMGHYGTIAKFCINGALD